MFEIDNVLRELEKFTIGNIFNFVASASLGVDLRMLLFETRCQLSSFGRDTGSRRILCAKCLLRKQVSFPKDPLND